MFLTKKHIPPPSSAEGCRSDVGAAVSRCDGACRHGSGPNGRHAQTADGLFLSSSRRDHVEHRAWPGNGSVDA